MVSIAKGAVKFRSIKAAFEAAKRREPNLKYITFYARVKAKESKLGLGWSASQASHRKVRKYERKVTQVVIQAQIAA
jgi:hypothetical protein